jgi:hypothetical protein
MSAAPTQVLERPSPEEALPERWTPSARGGAARVGFLAVVVGVLRWVKSGLKNWR